MGAAEAVARLAAATRAAFAVDGVGAGEGTVRASWDGDALVLAAAGTWAPDGRAVRWRATSRWRAEGRALAVAWVRPGDWATAVLDPAPDGRWVGRAPYVCGPDTYAAALRLGPEAAEVVWTVRGPRKDARVVMRVW